MMKEWIGIVPEVRVYHDSPDLSEGVARLCNDKDILQLFRSDTTGTTSTLGDFIIRKRIYKKIYTVLSITNGVGFKYVI